jgi:hypothetical protein
MELTVIPRDSFMKKDGVGLFFDFGDISGMEFIHAIQWSGSSGHVEYSNGSPNQAITIVGFLNPYLNAFAAEKARLDAIAAEELALYNSLPEVLKRKELEVDEVKEGKIADGIPYSFPDGAGTIQTRDLIDARNIQTNVTTAMILKSMGQIQPVMAFRDEENTLHPMTPDQMIAMGLYTAQYGQAIYVRSWQLKALVGTMTKEEIEAFDVAANW